MHGKLNTHLPKDQRHVVPTASFHMNTPVDAIMLYYAGRVFGWSFTVRTAFEDALCRWSRYYILTPTVGLGFPPPSMTRNSPAMTQLVLAIDPIQWQQQFFLH